MHNQRHICALHSIIKCTPNDDISNDALIPERQHLIIHRKFARWTLFNLLWIWIRSGKWRLSCCCAVLCRFLSNRIFGMFTSRLTQINQLPKDISPNGSTNHAQRSQKRITTTEINMLWIFTRNNCNLVTNLWILLHFKICDGFTGVWTKNTHFHGWKWFGWSIQQKWLNDGPFEKENNNLSKMIWLKPTHLKTGNHRPTLHVN